MSVTRFQRQYSEPFSTFRRMGADPHRLRDHDDAMAMIRYEVEAMMGEVMRDMANRGATAHGQMQMADDKVRRFTPALIIDDPDTFTVRVWCDGMA